MEKLIADAAIFIRNYSFLGIPASFLGGILTSLSPCILPILPVTLSIIGEAALNSKLKTLLLSLIFVLGITVTYVSLGLISAVFGIFLQKILKGFIIYLVLGAVFIFLGLSFFDLFHFSVFSANRTSRINLVSIFVLGLISGFVMIPCVFPVLGTILTLISLKQNIVYGILCLVSFSMGYGLILVLIGTSSRFINKLSEVTIGVIIIKRILGIIMITGGAYFIITTLRMLL